jgi:hypothetical protein
LDVAFGDNSNKWGHWIDRLPDIDGDIEDMRKKLEEAKAGGTTTGNQAFVRQVIRETQSPPDRLLKRVEGTPHLGCLGAQFKRTIFLRFCVRFLSVAKSILVCDKMPWRTGVKGLRAVSVGSSAAREWAPPHARRSLAVAGRAGQPGST